MPERQPPANSLELVLWKEAARESEDAAEEFERVLAAEKAANEARWAAEREQEMDEDRRLFGEDDAEPDTYDGGFLLPPRFRGALLATLGLKSNATVDEVKKAYLRLVKMTHPDKSDDDADRFRRINEAKVALIGGMYWSLKGGAWRRCMSGRG